MWTAPLSKKYNDVSCGNDKRQHKTHGNGKSVRNAEDQQLCYLKCYL